MYLGVRPEQVYDQYAAFYARRGEFLRNSGDEGYEHTIHDVNGGWVIVFHGIGWDWEARRSAMALASRELTCVAMHVFVYDGDYWGYELIRAGEPIDQFVQDPEPYDGSSWFPGKSTAGDAQAVASTLPWLAAADVAPYLIRQVHASDDPNRDLHERRAEWHAEYARLNVKARPGDEFTRFDECAVLDFLRLLGVDVQLRPHPAHGYERVTLMTPARHRYWTPAEPRPQRARRQ
jgi:hypothetical protein